MFRLPFTSAPVPSFDLPCGILFNPLAEKMFRFQCEREEYDVRFVDKGTELFAWQNHRFHPLKTYQISCGMFLPEKKFANSLRTHSLRSANDDSALADVTAN